MYENTKNGPPELCGCGTAAEIAYLGHKTTCVQFQWIHERSSYEVLLAVLKKRKKVSFLKYTNNQTKRPRLQSTSEDDVTDDGKEQSKKNNLTVLAEVAEVAQSQSSNSSLPDLIGDQISGADCPCEDDDEMPLLEDDEVTEL